MKTLSREKLKVVAARADASEQGSYVLDEQAGFLMRVAMQRHTSIFTSRMLEAWRRPNSQPWRNCTKSVRAHRDHLGRLIYLDAATIKGVVDRLHLRGFVTALSDPNDRRRRPVALTERGRQVTEAAMLVAAEITAATLTPLTADEQRMIAKLLRKLG